MLASRSKFLDGSISVSYRIFLHPQLQQDQWDLLEIVLCERPLHDVLTAWSGLNSVLGIPWPLLRVDCNLARINKFVVWYSSSYKLLGNKKESILQDNWGFVGQDNKR